MNFETVTLEEKIVVGLAVRTTNEGSKAMTDIGSLWGKFIGEGAMNQIDNKINEKGIGLYTDYEGDATMPYTFMCGVEVSKVTNDDFETKIIPAGKYAKFTIKGHMVEAVGAAWGEIWAMDLDRKYSCDFEYYHNDSEDMNNQTIDIFIALN